MEVWSTYPVATENYLLTHCSRWTLSFFLTSDYFLEMPLKWPNALGPVCEHHLYADCEHRQCLISQMICHINTPCRFRSSNWIPLVRASYCQGLWILILSFCIDLFLCAFGLFPSSIFRSALFMLQFGHRFIFYILPNCFKWALPSLLHSSWFYFLSFLSFFLSRSLSYHLFSSSPAPSVC